MYRVEGVGTGAGKRFLGESMGATSNGTGRRSKRRYSRARVVDAAREAAGREAVALLFTGLAVHSPIRDLVTSQSSNPTSEPDATADSGPEPDEIWVLEPIDTEIPWADDALDDSFGDELSWFEPDDPLLGDPLAEEFVDNDFDGDTYAEATGFSVDDMDLS